MPARSLYCALKVLCALSALLLLADGARAYVGPGAGLELVGYSTGLLAWVAVAFSALFLYPLYSFLRWLRGGGAGPKDAPAASAPAARDGQGAGTHANP